ncbi:MAG: nitrophenyl compound nitroreductase subunit ArsF family protein [Kiritimatiellia bacterium]
MERAKNILTKLLIAFVLISIGFALGKHSARSDTSSATQSNMQGNYVAVYYMHSTFRCVTCNTIEKMTRELLDKSYAEELADGRIKWQEVDFQENEELARKFEIVSSCVVVAQVKDGEVSVFKRLDEVWTLMKDTDSFNQYIGDAINAYLRNDGGQL